ncbi:hypothetical protein [Streptomyces sp. NPDC000133]|uniref:hypothetical protein n=1 Tax=Streptomyces sp. NPDC000133 TaxID=3364535 RepID=UPI00369C3BA9
MFVREQRRGDREQNDDRGRCAKDGDDLAGEEDRPRRMREPRPQPAAAATLLPGGRLGRVVVGDLFEHADDRAPGGVETSGRQHLGDADTVIDVGQRGGRGTVYARGPHGLLVQVCRHQHLDGRVRVAVQSGDRGAVLVPPDGSTTVTASPGTASGSTGGQAREPVVTPDHHALGSGINSHLDMTR